MSFRDSAGMFNLVYQIFLHLIKLNIGTALLQINFSVNLTKLARTQMLDIKDCKLMFFLVGRVLKQLWLALILTILFYWNMRLNLNNLINLFLNLGRSSCSPGWGWPSCQSKSFLRWRSSSIRTWKVSTYCNSGWGSRL